MTDHTTSTDYVGLRLADEHLLFSLLDEHMNANGIEPHVAGLDAEGAPFVAWLNESGGDEVYLTVTRLVVDDGAVTEHTEQETPGQGQTTSLAYPVVVLTPPDEERSDG